MFNLLVNGDGTAWETDQLMKMPADRFTKNSGTESAAVSLKQPDTLKTLEPIRSLLMYEAGFATSDIVRYGYLRDIRVSGSDVVFRFLEKGRFTRKQISEFARRLGINTLEFGRTHLAIKDGDLPGNLLAHLQTTFDVFLSHNSHDKPAVRELKKLLEARHLAVWLDADELRPGIPWQRLLEQGIESSRSIAVIVGKDGLGPWEVEEMEGALRLAVKDGRPIIPVLFPGASAKPKLPMFLGNRTWVDFSAGFTNDRIGELFWGITGIRPSP